MASPGGAATPGEGTAKTPGKSLGGATAHTPGSGKRRHRKKNSPKQKSDQKEVPQKDKLVVEGDNYTGACIPETELSSPKGTLPAGDKPTETTCNAKTDNESKPFKSESKYPKTDSKTSKSENESKEVLKLGSEVSRGQEKDENIISQEQKQPKGASQSPGKGQSVTGQGKGQGKAKDEQSDQKKGEGQGATGDLPQKSKAELKAERRAKQEAQRAAKDKKKTETSSSGAPGAASKKDIPRVPDNMKADVEGTRKKIVKKLEKQQVPVRTVVQRKVRLFNHLHQYEREASLTRSLTFSSSGIHPAIVKLGLQYAEGIISGSNARCIGLLAALKKVIDDYTTPPHKELSRDLEAKIKPYISFLTQCRPLSVSMGNAIKYVKWQITNIPGDMSDMRAKEIIKESMDKYWRENIQLAGVAISQSASSKIADNDVIVVYACSSLIRKVLCDAHRNGKKFRVIVVDGRPRLEGKEMLRRLVQAGIPCSYVLISATSYIMKEATKVLLGAHGLLANGFVMSRVGTSMIALIAKSFSVPVLVCCETYKFCKRVQTDSFVGNELGDPDDLVEIGKKDAYLMDWRDYQSLSLLNLVYDVTPPEFISMVITEIGMIPCTSVPVVLRVKHSETSEL